MQCLFTEIAQQYKWQSSSQIIYCISFNQILQFFIYSTLPLFFHPSSLRPLSFLFAECPTQLASTFSLFAAGIVPCMSSVAIRRTGLDERCFSGPRPPHLWMETIELFFMSRWPHIHTLPGKCPAAARPHTLNSRFKERVDYKKKARLLSLLWRMHHHCTRS